MKAEYLAQFEPGINLEIPLYATQVPAGFPSPADDYLDRKLSLDELLIDHPAATFFCRVSGDSMVNIGIFNGDLLIVDRAVEAKHRDVVIAALDGELTCKTLDRHRNCLVAEAADHPSIPVGEGSDLVIEGVVLYSIRAHRCSR